MKLLSNRFRQLLTSSTKLTIREERPKKMPEEKLNLLKNKQELHKNN
jgi:hypothetical protein